MYCAHSGLYKIICPLIRLNVCCPSNHKNSSLISSSEKFWLSILPFNYTSPICKLKLLVSSSSNQLVINFQLLFWPSQLPSSNPYKFFRKSGQLKNGTPMHNLSKLRQPPVFTINPKSIRKALKKRWRNLINVSPVS